MSEQEQSEFTDATTSSPRSLRDVNDFRTSHSSDSSTEQNQAEAIAAARAAAHAVATAIPPEEHIHFIRNKLQQIADMAGFTTTADKSISTSRLTLEPPHEASAGLPGPSESSTSSLSSLPGSYQGYPELLQDFRQAFRKFPSLAEEFSDMSGNLSDPFEGCPKQTEFLEAMGSLCGSLEGCSKPTGPLESFRDPFLKPMEMCHRSLESFSENYDRFPGSLGDFSNPKDTVSDPLGFSDQSDVVSNPNGLGRNRSESSYTPSEGTLFDSQPIYQSIETLLMKEEKPVAEPDEPLPELMEIAEPHCATTSGWIASDEDRPESPQPRRHVYRKKKTDVKPHPHADKDADSAYDADCGTMDSSDS